MNLGDVLSRIKRLNEQLDEVEGEDKPAKKRRQRLNKRITKVWGEVDRASMSHVEKIELAYALQVRNIPMPPQ